MIAAPLSLVSETPARVSLNFLSLYTLKEPLDAEPLSTYSTPATDAFTVTCAPFVVTVTPLTEPVTVAEPLAYAICMEEANDELGPYDQLVIQERMAIIHRLINELPEKQRLIMQLRDIEGESYKEIADVLHLTEEQVKVNLFRARQKVKQRYTEIEGYGL